MPCWQQDHHDIGCFSHAAYVTSPIPARFRVHCFLDLATLLRLRQIGIRGGVPCPNIITKLQGIHHLWMMRVQNSAQISPWCCLKGAFQTGCILRRDTLLSPALYGEMTTSMLPHAYRVISINIRGIGGGPGTQTATIVTS